MKHFITITLTLCLILSSSFIAKSVDKEQALSKTERLYLTCKVWGFLKYYHPKVGTGVYDWDQKLLGVLKNTSNITTQEQLNTYLYRWIYAIGPRKPCASCKQKNQDPLFLKNFDLRWLYGNTFSEELKKTFADIENNRFQGDHHYIGKGKADQFEPKNEESFYELDWTDENQRMLPLFRFWNYVEYFYPYKYLTDQDWDDVLKEMIPTFLNAESKLDFHLAMLELVVKLDDSHAGLVTPVLDQWPYYNYLPVQFELIENKAIITSIIDEEKARLADLQVGDAITSINGRDVLSHHRANKKYIWGSNEAAKDRNIFHTLFMGLTSSPKVTIERGSGSRTIDLPLYKYSDISYTKSAPKEKWNIPTDSVGYVDLSKLEIKEVDEMMKELMDMSVLIFDVRNQPRGTYQAIAKYLLPAKTSFAAITKPGFSYPGKFIWSGERACGEENPDYFKGKVILLVNEKTQNHAEFTCMCLQAAPNILTMGSQTAGTNGPQSRLLLYSKYYSSFTGAGVYYYDEKEVQRVGIIPDIEVTPTLAGIREGKDDVLERALAVAREELAQLKEQARLKELARLDSIRMHSNLMDSLTVDSLSIKDDQ